MAYKSKFMKALAKGEYDDDITPMREATDQTFPEVSTGEYKSKFMREKYAQQEQQAIARTFPETITKRNAEAAENSLTANRYRAQKDSDITLMGKATGGESLTENRYKAQKDSAARRVEGSEIPESLTENRYRAQKQEQQEKTESLPLSMTGAPSIVSNLALQDMIQRSSARLALQQDTTAQDEAREAEVQGAEARQKEVQQELDAKWQQLEGLRNNGGSIDAIRRAENDYAALTQEMDQLKSTIAGSAMEEAAQWEGQKYNEIMANGGEVLLLQLEKLAELAQGRYDEDEDSRRTGTGASAQYNELYEQLKSQYGDQLDSWIDYAKRMGNLSDMQERLGKWEQRAEEHPFWSSVASVGTNLAGGTGLLDAAGQKLNRAITGSDTPIDYNSPGQSASKITNTVRGTVSKDMSPVGSFLYNTGMSMADSLATMGVGAATGVGSLGTVLLGGSAATSAMQEAIERGASDSQALTIGLFAGAAETLMEKASIDSLFNLKSPEKAKDVILNILKQAGAEGTEEGLTTIVNTLADAFVMGDRSELETSKRAYMEQGYDSDKAEGMALRDWLINVGIDVGGGMLSGGAFTTGHAAFNGAMDVTGNAVLNALEQAENRATPQSAAQTVTVREPSGEAAVAKAVEMAVNENAPSQKAGTVVADTTRFDSKILSNLNQARTYLIEYAKSHFPTSVTNEETGNTIAIPRKGLDKFLSGRISRDKYATGFHIPELIEQAHKVGSANNYHTEQVGNAPTYEYYDSPVTVDGIDYTAHIRVKNSVMGDKYYGHTISEVDNIEIEPSARTSVPGNPAVQPVNAIDDSNTSIRSDSKNVNREITVDDVMPKVDNGRNEAMGAADYGFNAYSNYQNTQSEFLPDRANAARQVDIPATDPTGQKTSRFTSNAAGAQVVPDRGVAQIESDFLEGKYGYGVKGDQQAIDKAKQMIDNKGYAEAKGQTVERLQSLKNLKQTVVDAQILIQQAYQNGQDADAAELLLSLAEASPEIAQGLQAYSIFQKLTPEGQLTGLQRTITNLEEKVNRKLSKKARNEFEGLTVDESLKQKFLNAADEDSRAAVLEEIYQDIGSKIPTTFKDIVNQWRYTSMLLNPSTHARNIVGNTGQLGLSTTKDALATLGEMGVDWASKKLRHGKGIERTKAFLNLASESDSQLVKMAGQDYDTVARDIIMGGSKYNDSAEGKINQYRDIWKLNDPQSKVAKAADATLRGVGKVSDVNSNLMDVEDTWFSRPMYQVALAGYMKANGLTEITDAARSYAVKEAKKSTYRDSNIISDWAKRMGRDDKGLGKVVSFVVNTIFPFKGTPANVGVRAWEYSPAGLLTALGKGAVSAYNGTFNAASFIDDLSAGVTGTIAAGIGLALAQNGILKVSTDDQDEAEGYESNSVNLFGYSVPINNLGSVAIPILVGGAIYENFVAQNPDDDGHTLDEFLKALSATLDPVLESSMLTGLQDLVDSFESGDYGDASLGEMVQAGMINVVGNYIASYIPTILSKIANATDTAARKTYVDRNRNTTGQYEMQSWQKKIPGLRQQMTEMVDQYGDTVAGGLPEDGSVLSKIGAAVAGAVSPTYWSKIKTTELDTELRRLNASEDVDSGNYTLLYTDPPKDFEVDGKTVYLTGEQWEQYAKTRNSTTHQIRNDIMDSEQYADLSDDVKAAAMDLAYQYANNLGKASAGVGYTITTKWMNELAGAEPEEVTETIINKAVANLAEKHGSNKYDGLANMLEDGSIEDKVAISLLPDSTFELWESYGEKYKVPVSTLMDVISYGNSDESKTEYNVHDKAISGKGHQDKMKKYINSIQGLSASQKKGIWKIAVSEKGDCPW